VQKRVPRTKSPPSTGKMSFYAFSANNYFLNMRNLQRCEQARTSRDTTATIQLKPVESSRSGRPSGMPQGLGF